MVSLDNKDLSYIAGFFDGEGYITLHHKTKNNVIYLCVGINNTEKEVLYWIKNLFGGSISSYKDKRSIKWKRIYRWQIFSQQALIFLNEIQPYLKIKDKKCTLAIIFQKRQRRGVKTMDLKEKLYFKEEIKCS